MIGCGWVGLHSQVCIQAVDLRQREATYSEVYFKCMSVKGIRKSRQLAKHLWQFHQCNTQSFAQLKLRAHYSPVISLIFIKNQTTLRYQVRERRTGKGWGTAVQNQDASVYVPVKPFFSFFSTWQGWMFPHQTVFIWTLHYFQNIFCSFLHHCKRMLLWLKEEIKM